MDTCQIQPSFFVWFEILGLVMTYQMCKNQPALKEMVVKSNKDTTMGKDVVVLKTKIKYTSLELFRKDGAHVSDMENLRQQMDSFLAAWCNTYSCLHLLEPISRIIVMYQEG